MSPTPEPSLTTAQNAPAVAVNGLVKRYLGRTVVDHLDLQAHLGAVTAVLGPNGAGKTTTIEICEGLRDPDGGTVRVLGRHPRDRDLRTRVGVMLQDGGVYGTVSASEALHHAASLFATPHPPNDLLTALALTDVAETPSRRLSGGQRQRLSLALAIIGRPELVFLDEPTAGLDPHSRRSVWDLIAELREAGVGVVLTTHYLEEAEQLADHVVIIDAGRTIAAGKPSDLVATPHQAHVQFTASASLDLSRLIPALPDGSSVREVSPGTYAVLAAGLVDALAPLTQWFSAEGVTPTSINSEARTLEDVFLELTSEERT